MLVFRNRKGWGSKKVLGIKYVQKDKWQPIQCLLMASRETNMHPEFSGPDNLIHGFGVRMSTVTEGEKITHRVGGNRGQTKPSLQTLDQGLRPGLPLFVETRWGAILSEGLLV